MSMEELYAQVPAELYEVRTRTEGPKGRLPLTDEMSTMWNGFSPCLRRERMHCGKSAVDTESGENYVQGRPLTCHNDFEG